MESEGTTVALEVENLTRDYRVHECSPACLLEENQWSEVVSGKGPLVVPLVLGWTRQLARHSNKGVRKVCYVAPCGRRCRDLREVQHYLLTTGLQLQIDCFSFEWWVHVLDIFQSTRPNIEIVDLSHKGEARELSCVNTVDHIYPQYMDYSNVRLPQRNVHINTQPEFLVGCDCPDNCADKVIFGWFGGRLIWRITFKLKEKCACWQETIFNTRASNTGAVVDTEVGYEFKRLKADSSYTHIHLQL